MRIGIVGGGAAGLTSAWLLEAEHDVTLFEREARLGGHAHTVEIDAHGERIAVDAGFQFFADTRAYATFNRLLDVLGVVRESYPATLTLFHAVQRRALALPPVRGGRPVRGSLTPRALADLIRFRMFLAGAPAFLARRDTTLTIAEYLERQRLPRAFVDDVLLPLLLAFWCVEPAEFQRFAAYNALYYLGANMPRGLGAPVQSEIAGGLKVYIDALVGALRTTRIHLGADVTSIRREADTYEVTDGRGIPHSFDHVIVATNARQALHLIGAVAELEPVRRQLARFEYFDTTIALHGDPTLMPPRRADWSVVNARWDGAHSHLTVWNPQRGLPVFKSWVTFDERMPEPLYARVAYEHGMVTPDYFDAQRQLKALQGRRGFWLAGLYAHDADSHESAVASAVDVAQRLAPRSARLALLAGGARR